MEIEASSALVLLGMTFAALIWANSPVGSSYSLFWNTSVSFAVGEEFRLSLTLTEWVNDGLMAIFFFVVGMEIKRELVLGQLSSRQKAMLPIAGALGGMIVPAGIYLIFHQGQPTESGWGVPMATDIAFALAALSLLGSRVPSGLRVFLLALAIADDLGAVTVIALFYTAELHLASLGWALSGCALCFALNKAGFRSFALYALVGAFIWLETHHSGIHATVAGVLLGFLTPTASDSDDDKETLADISRKAAEDLRNFLTRRDDPDPGGHHRNRAIRTLEVVGRRSLSPLDFLMHRLERWVAFGIMPVFALANAGVIFEADVLDNSESMNVAIAVFLGLVVGKPLGITIFSYLAVRLGFARLPEGVNWSTLCATGMLAGIGFTVALFITVLAFNEPAHIAGSKIGILAGSVVATVVGLTLLGRTLPDRGR
jgi:NhaA family Na+:H+ antiporter